MSQKLKFMMISAMYENGGNTTHRMLDGHPELHVYPFESQLGTADHGFHLANDWLSSFIPPRYRYPEFPMQGDLARDYEMFWDEEMKTLLRAPGRSKFRDAGLQLNEADRKKAFFAYMKGKERTRANLVDAFFNSTFSAWKNLPRTGKEKAYLGYSPVIGIDAEEVVQEFPDGHIIHVVRNPYSGYSDTCTYASWNGKKLEQVYPWGTIRTPTPEANVATMNELNAAEKKEMRSLTAVMRRSLGYENW